MLGILVTWLQKYLLHSVSETLGPLHMTAVTLCEPGGDPLKQMVLGSEHNKALLPLIGQGVGSREGGLKGSTASLIEACLV